MTRRLIPDWLRRLRARIRAMDRILEMAREVGQIGHEVVELREAIGRIETRQLGDSRGSLQDHEFRVFSQNGEDGIIQFLVNNIEVPHRTFVEVGVEDYEEANTRFLLVNDRWRGLLLDGNTASVERIRQGAPYLTTDLTATAAFVTRENVNELLRDGGMSGDLGLLSLDVDGNDYWLLDAITEVRPAIAVVEYNHRFGPTRSVTIPYEPAFVRRRTDWTWLFAGASITAIARAAERKGLAFVGCNRFGNNAFFVQRDLLPGWMPKLTPEEGYVRGAFRETVVIDGVERVPTAEEEAALLARAQLVDVP